MTGTADGAAAPEDTFGDHQLDRDTDGISLSSPALGELSARERAQQRLIQARTSVREATVRVRSSASLPTRRVTERGDGSNDAPAITLADRAQAYRVHVVSFTFAVILLVGAFLRRRVRAHRVGDVVDLGQWHLHAEPIDE